jgi:hypothetical protein
MAYKATKSIYTYCYLASGVSIYENNFKIIPEKLAVGHNGQGNLDYAIECRSTNRIVGLVEDEREFNIKYRDYACFISTDDKHKVPIGEDVPVSTGVRNKKTLAPAEGEITAADHDFTKLSLTPSITLFINIPNDISESFYDGKVYACFKDAIFQPSSTLRHSTEFFNLMNRQYPTQFLPSILSLYTDGGPDHRCTFGSVQIALICLFLAGNFDISHWKCHKN